MSAEFFADTEASEISPSQQPQLTVVPSSDFRSEAATIFQNARENWLRNKRKFHAPSPDAIHPIYLTAIQQFIAEPLSTQTLETLMHDEIVAPIDIRFGLQASINYLAVRNLEGKSSDEECVVIDNLKRFTETEDLISATTEAKKAVRDAIELSSDKPQLPDNAPLVYPRGVKALSIKHIGTLARLATSIDRSDQASPHLQQICEPILEAQYDPHSTLTTLKGVNARSARRESLRSVVENFTDDATALAFIEAHPAFMRPLLYHFEENRDVLIMLYLNDLESGDPFYIPLGNLETKVTDVVGRSDQAEFLITYAKSIEEKNKHQLGDIIDPFTGDFRDSFIELVDSEQILVDILNSASGLGTGNQLATINQSAHDHASARKDRIELSQHILGRHGATGIEKRIPDIAERIRKVADGVLGWKLDMIGHLQLSVVAGISTRSAINLQEKGYLKPRYGRDHHPVYTQEEAAAASILDELRDGLTKKEANEILELIKLEFASRRKPQDK